MPAPVPPILALTSKGQSIPSDAATRSRGAVDDPRLRDVVAETRDQRELPRLAAVNGKHIRAVQHLCPGRAPMVQQGGGVEDAVLRLAQERRHGDAVENDRGGTAANRRDRTNDRSVALPHKRPRAGPARRTAARTRSDVHRGWQDRRSRRRADASGAARLSIAPGEDAKTCQAGLFARTNPAPIGGLRPSGSRPNA